MNVLPKFTYNILGLIWRGREYVFKPVKAVKKWQHCYFNPVFLHSVFVRNSLLTGLCSWWANYLNRMLTFLAIHIAFLICCTVLKFIFFKSSVENELASNILWRSSTEVRHYTAKLGRTWLETSSRIFFSPSKIFICISIPEVSDI